MLYCFDGYTLDLTRGCLEAAGREVELRPKGFAILRHLLENGKRLISKEELVAAVWPQAVVTDESLTRCISDVRAAIADHEHKIIKTVPRRGYLFTADVTRHEHAAPRRQRSGAEVVTERTVADLPSIAVLAFDNMSGDASQDYVSDGITEDIITELSRFAELLVIARNSSFRYKGQSVDVRQVGRELGVRYVLEGSVRRAGDRIRISAQLIDAVTGAHLWAERYDRKLADVFAVQDEVTHTIVALLTAHVNKAEVERTSTKPPTTWRAYDYHLRATEALISFWPSFEVAHLYEARRLLERSLALDAGYARAYGTLSRTYVLAWGNRLDDDHLNAAALDRAHQLALKGIQLDPNLPVAHAHLGSVLTWKRQHDAALAAFDRAIALNPNFTDWRLASALIYAGEPERAIEVVRAHMRLDPYYPALVPGWLGLAHYQLKRYSEALAPLRECTSRMPNYRSAHAWLAATYAQLGLQEEAQAAVAEVLRLQPNYRISRAARLISGFKRAKDDAHFFGGLRKAGLQE